MSSALKKYLYSIEAKDAVEKIPGVLKANVLKKDAEAIKEQLAKIGCKVNLKWIYKN